MDDYCYHHRKKHRKKAACLICTLITILVIILLLTLYFAVFKPKDPVVEVPLMHIVSYSAVGTPPNMSTLTWGLNLDVSIYNPNRGDFYMEDVSTTSLFYGNSQLGVAFLPKNLLVPSQSSIAYGVPISLHTPIVVNMSAIYFDGNIIPLPLSSVVTIYGHVTTVGVFTHHSSVVSVCNITIALGGPKGNTLSYSCRKSYSIDD